jgi:hypothetical protein
MGLLLLVRISWTQAQSPGGIFSQGTTELKNNAAQLLALQALGATSQEDYEALETGLTNIGDIHGAEFALHRQYFASLAAVNPRIAGLPETKEVGSMAPALSATLSAEIDKWTSSGGLTPGELAAMTALDSGLSRAGQAELAVLQTLLTPGELTMSDAERIQAIRQLAEAVRAQYEFMEQAGAEGNVLIANRKRL